MSEIVRGGALVGALAAEIDRHERELEQLRGMRSLAERMFAIDGVAEPAEREQPALPEPPAADPPPAPDPPPETKPARPKGGATNKAKVLAALHEQPMTLGQLVERTGVPKGSMGATLGDLAWKGKIVKPAVRGGTWSLASPNGVPDDDGIDKGHLIPMAITRVLEHVYAHPGTEDQIKEALDLPEQDVADALDELQEKGDLTYNGDRWEPSP